MKKCMNRWIALMLVCMLLCGTFTTRIRAASQKNFWLGGVSTMADGKMRIYYKGSKGLALKGKFKTASSLDELWDMPDKKGSYFLKVAKNCKIETIEADTVGTTDYAAWVKNCGFEKGDLIPFVSVSIKVKNKKIVKLIFSA